MTKMDSRGMAVMAVVLLVLVWMAPTLNSYYQTLVFSLLMTSAFTLAWAVLATLTNYLSFGHMAFFAVGAYTAANLTSWHPVLQLLAAAITGAAMGALFIVPVMRLRGMYFALASLGLSEIALVLALEADSLTGGSTGTPVLSPLTQGDALRYVGILAVLICVALAWLRRSRLGLRLIAMRTDEGAAEAAGVPTRRYKTTALLVSAALTSVVGATYAWWLSYVDAADVFSIHKFVVVVAGAVLGGIGTLTGALLGGLTFGAFYELAWVNLPLLHEVVAGMIILLGATFLPRGILGTIVHNRGRSEASTSREQQRQLVDDTSPTTETSQPTQSRERP